MSTHVAAVRFCSNCGAAAGGNFCAACGARLAPAAVPVVAAADWQDEVRYAVLLHFPEVRDRIARSAAQAPAAAMTGERFLELCDKAFAPLVGVSLAKVAAISAPIFGRLGVKTGKTRADTFPQPAGQVLIAVLCALARRGQTLERVQQGTNGCVIEAILPSDVWSFAGQIVVAVERAGSTTRVEAATKIPGQLFDWGKSDRCLTQLFEDVRALA